MKMAINRESIRNHKSSKSLVIVNCSMCCIICIKIKLKRIQHCRTFQKFNRKITERIKIDDPNAQIHD
jgi:hypothetical protein